MSRDVVVLFAQPEGQKLVRKHCKKVGLEVSDLKRMVEETIDNTMMQRRRRLWQAFDELLDDSKQDSV